jgi:hypothetical protein
MGGLDSRQFEQALSKAFARFVTILNVHTQLRDDVAHKQEEFLERANKTAQSALEDIQKRHEDISSADTNRLWALLTPEYVLEFPPILNRLWLIGSVSAFEVYPRNIIIAVLRHKPDLIEQKYRKEKAPLHKHMAELNKFYLKLNFLEGKRLIVFKEKEFPRHQLEEITLRRNLFVHSDGIVDEPYVKWVKGTSYKVGDEIDISGEYCEKSVKCLAQAVVHLQMSLLEKFVKKIS